MESTLREIARQAARKAFDGADTFDQFDQIADAVAKAVIRELEQRAIVQGPITCSELEDMLSALSGVEAVPSGLVEHLARLRKQIACSHHAGNGHGYEGTGRYCHDCNLWWPVDQHPREFVFDEAMAAVRAERQAGVEAAPFSVARWICRCGARNYRDGTPTCWKCKQPETGNQATQEQAVGFGAQRQDPTPQIGAAAARQGETTEEDQARLSLFDEPSEYPALTVTWGRAAKPTPPDET